MKTGGPITSESELILIALQELANPPTIDYWALMREPPTGEFEIVDLPLIQVGVRTDTGAEEPLPAGDFAQRH